MPKWRGLENGTPPSPRGAKDLEQSVIQLKAEQQQWQTQLEKADGDERWRELQASPTSAPNRPRCV